MSSPSTREELKDWCLRQLGVPVSDVELDDDQIEDAIDLAFQYFQDFHFDAIERTYLKHQLTATDVTNQYITIPSRVTGVTRIFPVGGTNATTNMFDLRYQMRLNDLHSFTSTSYVSYVITQQHIRTLDMLFSGETPIRFNRHANRMYLDWDWATKLDVDEYIIIECWAILEPDSIPQVYNDRMLKGLATAYLKKQWGANLKKFSGMKLPGDVTFNGQEIYNEGVLEASQLESLIRTTHEKPPMFLIG